jgi:hypothetical protein
VNTVEWRTLKVLAFGVTMLILTTPGQSGRAAAQGQLVGGALIGDPIPGKTIPSTSDVGFAVTSDGGTFVCSMAGPLTGGFKGLKVMTVEGPVTKGSLIVKGQMATFKGSATVVLAPGMDKKPVQILSDVPFMVTVGTGGPGKGWLLMDVPAFTKTLGGDTGGYVKIGHIMIE